MLVSVLLIQVFSFLLVSAVMLYFMSYSFYKKNTMLMGNYFGMNWGNLSAGLFDKKTV